MGVSSTSTPADGEDSAERTEMVPWVRTMGEKLRQRLRLDVGREICRQYPLFCFLLLCLSAASVLLNRYFRSADPGGGFFQKLLTTYRRPSGPRSCGAGAGAGCEAAGQSELGARKCGRGGLWWPFARDILS